MKAEVVTTDMLKAMWTQGRNWRCSQPEQLKKIERIAVGLSKIAYKCGEDGKQEYINRKCEEIKQLADDYQKKVGCMR